MRSVQLSKPGEHAGHPGSCGIANKVTLGISRPVMRNFDINSDIVIATFSNIPSACTITNAAALAGKIAMFDFDNTDGTGCAFSTRITRIHATAASAALMVYTSASPTAVANITGIVATHTKGTASSRGTLVRLSRG
jgi:hypothetical protein